MHRTTSAGRTVRIHTETVFSAGSSKATLLRRLPTQYELFVLLHFCVADAVVGPPPTAGDFVAGTAAVAVGAEITSGQ